MPKTIEPARASGRTRRRRFLSAMSVCIGLGVGCSAPPEKAPPPASEERSSAASSSKSSAPVRAPAADINELFDVHLCATCHKGEIRFKKKDFDLAPEVMEENLAGRLSDQAEGMLLIEPGDPERSYLYHKLRGTHGEVGGYGRPMPSYSKKPTLSREELAIARRWIENMKR